MCSTALQWYAVRLPSYCANAIVMWVAAFCACANEYATGTPTITVLVPVIVVQAPGAGALTSVLNAMNSGVLQATDSASAAIADAWFRLLMMGVTYTLGFTVALEMWRPFLRLRPNSLAAAEDDGGAPGARVAAPPPAVHRLDAAIRVLHSHDSGRVTFAKAADAPAGAARPNREQAQSSKLIRDASETGLGLSRTFI
jgi:hypothetical protein